MLLPIGSMELFYLPTVHEWLIFMVNAGKYVSPMDPMPRDLQQSDPRFTDPTKT